MTTPPANMPSYRREMVFGLKDISDIKDISSWLNGRAKLETSIDPGGYFMASVVGQIECERMSKRFTLARVTFECDPFFYLTSGDTTVTDTSSPLALTNLGTVAAAPYIKITGSGEVVLTINDVTTIFTVSTYIDVTAFYKLCYKDTVNAGASMVGEYPVLPTGTVNVSWTGTVTKVDQGAKVARTMIRAYDRFDANPVHNGNVLQPISAIVYEEANGMFELEMELPKGQMVYRGDLILAPTPRDQYFRVYRAVPSLQGPLDLCKAQIL